MSNPENRRDLYVYGDWDGLKGPMLMGYLHAELLRGNEIFSFEYHNEWLHSGFAQILDPDLHLYSGVQYLSNRDKINFGIFLDSSPDRWGRVLMLRREAALARVESRLKRQLFESDYLLGVFDQHRMGALRFKLDPEGPFLNDDKECASPPWTSIRELEQISLKLEDDEVIDDPEYLKWLNLLIAPGSSLGGARPKASITDSKGNLWIAKFPSRNDQMDIGGWEMVTYELAIAAGVTMAECQVRKFSSDHYTFLTKRFDRYPKGKRLHFASAMTMLDHTDGDDYSEGVSYLELVEFIATHGARVDEDLEQLWRRIVFSICVANVDDHLRNHGFILTDSGWRLSPAFDINPVETGSGLKLNISDTDNALDLGLALEVSDFFRLSKDRAQEIIQEVRCAVREWRKIARKYGIPQGEQELKSLAFSRSQE